MRANLVGRSLVSAITHTPASGPFGPLTTPPMSSASIATVSPDCDADTRGDAACHPATLSTSATAPIVRLCVFNMSASPQVPGCLFGGQIVAHNERPYAELQPLLRAARGVRVSRRAGAGPGTTSARSPEQGRNSDGGEGHPRGAAIPRKREVRHARPEGAGEGGRARVPARVRRRETGVRHHPRPPPQPDV